MMPHYATRRSLRCSRKSLRCCFACRFCHGSRDKRYRMFPSQETIISIRTRATRCLISTCKIPANLPYNPRRGSPRWPRDPRRKTPESSHTFSLRYSGARPVMPAWRSMAHGAQRYLSRGALRYKQGQREPVTFLAHHRPPSLGIKPRVTPFFGRHVCQVADAMIEALLCPFSPPTARTKC